MPCARAGTMPVIVDTTVWIDFFEGTNTPQSEFLDTLVRQGDAAIGDLILTEVLQGIDDDKEYRLVKRHLSDFHIYPMIGRDYALKSAMNYRKLRAKGFTIRKTVDCWIATFCIERRFPLLHNDRDFDAFEQHLKLKVLRR